ncbi:MAG: CBS domain-containing protein [Deltaproteobacteria bacterium]|jgi:acetoin utilization protein AcuB|nr:CBS domain-containing protein [Deltaproteobacteria bacterium]
MLVKNWMRQPAITTDADDTAADADRLLQTHEIHMLPVMHKGELVGVVTDRDIKIASGAGVTSGNLEKFRDLLSGIKVKHIMTPDPVTVPLDYTLEEAVEKLLVHHISGLPVVDRLQKVVGVITRSDLFNLILILSGFGKKGLQFTLEVEDQPDRLREISDILRDYGVRISSILSTNERADRGKRRLYIRLFDIDQPSLQHLKKSLKEKATLLYIVDYHNGKREFFGEGEGARNVKQQIRCG